MTTKKQKPKINDDKLKKRLGFIPHKGQKPVLEKIKNDDIKDVVLVCGRRWGKTKLVAYLAFREMLLPNRQVWIVAPTSDLTQKAFTEIVKFIGKMYEPGEYRITTKPYTKLRMANGSWIECKTADNPVSLIGEEVDLLIIDEAARLAPMTYDRELAATTMTRNGRTIFISTPKGLNWFYHKYKQVSEADDGFVWNAPSSDNPLNTPKWLEKLRKSLPEEIYNQEYNASFIDGASSVFRNIDKVINDDCYENPVPTHRYVLGVDLAKVNDYTVLTCVDRHTHKVVAWDRFNKIDYPIQKNRIVSLARRYNNARIIIDSTGVGNPITDDLRRESLIIDDFKFSNKSKDELVQKLNLFIEEQGIFIPNEPIIIDELKQFGVEVTDRGNITYSAPVGLHDDCVMSLGLAVWGLYSTDTIKDKKEDPINFLLEEPTRRKIRVRR